jgi:hypothetical protein
LQKRVFWVSWGWSENAKNECNGLFFNYFLGGRGLFRKKIVFLQPNPALPGGWESVTNTLFNNNIAGGMPAYHQTKNLFHLKTLYLG